MYSQPCIKMLENSNNIGKLESEQHRNKQNNGFQHIKVKYTLKNVHKNR